ncbi:Nramp family divalent metal transporter [Tsukamurella soli]|uniref:Nramp family divalent metal transporter n=2 Tax=Tsukamurella soli TaxID=644556 RepID=A0ABP8J9Q5_9ACTN
MRTRVGIGAAVVGPGILALVNDAGSVAIDTQAGQDFGYRLLWVLVLMIPVLVLNQDMVVRLGTITGCGLVDLFRPRFGRAWTALCLSVLTAVNVLTIVSEFMGVSLAASSLGVSPVVAVPVAVTALVGVALGRSPRFRERAMLVLVAIGLVQLPMMLLAHPQWPRLISETGPTIGGSSGSLLLAMGIVGTTISPWQLALQQSTIVEKAIPSTRLGYERADTVIGALMSAAGGTAFIVLGDYARRSAGGTSAFIDCGVTARLLDEHSSLLAGFFAVALMDASMIGAAAVALSTDRLIRDARGSDRRTQQGRRPIDTRHQWYCIVLVLASAPVLIPGMPLGFLMALVQVLAGLLLPGMTLMLLLLCNDRRLLGRWANRWPLNLFGIATVVGLVGLTAWLLLSTVDPAPDVRARMLTALATGGVGLGTAWVWRRRRTTFRMTAYPPTPWVGDRDDRR